VRFRGTAARAPPDCLRHHDLLRGHLGGFKNPHSRCVLSSCPKQRTRQEFERNSSCANRPGQKDNERNWQSFPQSAQAAPAHFLLEGVPKQQGVGGYNRLQPHASAPRYFESRKADYTTSKSTSSVDVSCEAASGIARPPCECVLMQDADNRVIHARDACPGQCLYVPIVRRTRRDA